MGMEGRSSLSVAVWAIHWVRLVRRSGRFPVMILICLIWCTGLSRRCASGAELLFSQGVGGAIGYHTITAADSLVELAWHSDVGYNEITDANPGVDPFDPEEGVRVTIPGQWILPDAPRRRGIVINLAEMRLYHFMTRYRDRVQTYPIGIGDEGWDTPVGTYHIVEKIVNPAWHVPASIRAEKPELPAVVPPGPDNPLGSHALRLSIGTVLIHGTDRPYGIGRRVSHGCIHLYPEDIVELFQAVGLGTTVEIVRQPVKATLADGRVLVEIHAGGTDDAYLEAVGLLQKKGLLPKVDLVRLIAAALAQSGMPTDVTRK